MMTASPRTGDLSAASVCVKRGLSAPHATRELADVKKGCRLIGLTPLRDNCAILENSDLYVFNPDELARASSCGRLETT